METNSFVINKIIQFFSVINQFYEYSFIYKIGCFLGSLISGSRIFNTLKELFFGKPKRDYISGSFFLRMIVGFFSLIFKIGNAIFNFFARLNGQSFNKSIFNFAIMPLKDPVNTVCAVSAALFGGLSVNGLYHLIWGSNKISPLICLVVAVLFLIICLFASPEITAGIKNSLPWRMLLSFMGNESLLNICNTQNNDSESNFLFKLLYAVIGAVGGVILIVLPLKYSVLFIGGAGFSIMAFFYLEMAFGIFIAVMACAPNELWNNMYIFLGAVFFSVVYALQYFMGRRKGIDLKFLAPSLMLYLFFCVISLFTGYGGTDSIRVFVILLGCVVFSLLMTNIISTTEHFQTVVSLITIAVTLSALYGIYRYQTGIEIRSEFVDLTKSQGLSRLISVMANSNNDAEFWAMILPFSIAYGFVTKNDAVRTAVFGMAGICLIGLVLTYSRAGYIAFAGAAGIFIVLTAPRLIPICLLAFIFMIPFIPSSITDRLMTIGKDTSSTYRTYIWQGSFRMAKAFWAQGIGMGPGAFATIYREFAHQSAKNAMHAHNVLLNVWVETGIGGLIAIGAYILRVFKTGTSAFYGGKDKFVKFYSAAAVSALIAFLIFSMVEYVWFYPRVMLCFWLVCGMTFSLAKMNRLEN